MIHRISRLTLFNLFLLAAFACGRGELTYAQRVRTIADAAKAELPAVGKRTGSKPRRPDG